LPIFQPTDPVDGLPGNPFNPHAWVIGRPEIGDDTWIGAFTVIDGSGGLTIGKGVNVSCGAALLTHNTVKRCVTGRKYPDVDRAPTVIEDYVFIGENATILMGCHIGKHSVIGAGAVILEGTVIPPYSMVVGVPGRIIKSIEDDVREWSGEELAKINF
jgi:acetyltransferase-like isoleucine patch superfamily enzyme